MRIERLIVKKTKPTVAVIRDIEFNTQGLSLIVDNTADASNESGNNVGKTTVIKIIDICLGAKSVRELYYDSDTRTENEIIKEFLSKSKVQAELVLIDNDYNHISIRRDLFSHGKKYIGDIELIEDDFWFELKKILFNSTDPLPTFRQLISKFVRVSDASAESMIKFLPGMPRHDIYDAIYSFLFQLLQNDLVSQKNSLSTQLSECQKAIALLEKNESIKSLSVLRQKKEIIDNDLLELEEKRKKLSYIEAYKDELEKKRKLSSKISALEESIQFLDFEIGTINDSIQKLADEKSQIDVSVVNSIYNEAEQYLPNIKKKFTEVIAFHNSMIQNRIDFIKQRKTDKQDNLDKISSELNELLEAKKQITIEILDEGLLDELNLLNRRIEELSVHKGEIIQSIKLLTEQEQNKVKLIKQIHEIESQTDEKIIEKNMTTFNNYFSEYCEKLYGEKYLLAYNVKWKEEKKFPIEVASFGGNVGTGKKKAVISAFDLAYLKYAEIKKIQSPQFVIHDKLENTHINQLKSIFEICQSINGQYIIPILRERINKIESEYIEKAKVLELSSKDKFFRM
jgi:uncharacterized protein YydD (DUF2326 family)